MSRTRVLSEVRKMRFEDVVGRYGDGRPTSEEAADLLGMSISWFYRWHRRFEAQGTEGLADGRLGKVTATPSPSSGPRRPRLSSASSIGYPLSVAHRQVCDSDFLGHGSSLVIVTTAPGERLAIPPLDADEREPSVAVMRLGLARRRATGTGGLPGTAKVQDSRHHVRVRPDELWLDISATGGRLHPQGQPQTSRRRCYGAAAVAAPGTGGEWKCPTWRRSTAPVGQIGQKIQINQRHFSRARSSRGRGLKRRPS